MSNEKKEDLLKNQSTTFQADNFKSFIEIYKSNRVVSYCPKKNNLNNLK